MVRKLAVTMFGVVRGLLGDPAPVAGERAMALPSDGPPRLATVTTPHDPARHAETYKVFTHLYDFPGNRPITKGVGGFDSHQRGICLGWRKTSFGGRVLDTWHMKGCFQRALSDGALETAPASGGAGHAIRIEWCDAKGMAFLNETRRFTLLPDTDTVRWIDVRSTLACVRERVCLRGDPHHGGMHIRLANEVCRHPWTTHFAIPRAAKWGRDDCVMGAWWVSCRFVVRARTCWLVFMTRPELESPPVYSARAYGKLGAFVEADVTPENPFHLQCRLGISEHDLGEETCRGLFRTMQWEDRPRTRTPADSTP